MQKQVKVMRGISGAGKSTFARKLVDEAFLRGECVVICSADDFFIDEHGVYQFDGTKLGEAHKACLSKFLAVVQTGLVDTIIVDNTNINIEDMAPYVALGELFNYDVEILQLNTSVAVATVRNVHGVPAASVANMERRLTQTKIPMRYKMRYVTNGA